MGEEDNASERERNRGKQGGRIGQRECWGRMGQRERERKENM